MNLLKTAGEKPVTTVALILSVVGIVWANVTDNAEIYGVSTNVIQIGSAILGGITLIANALTAKKQ